MEDHAHHADVRDLARFGHPQELRRALGVYSSFAVAFSYISPSTGIFTLYALGIGIGGPAFIWSWPLVVVGQLLVALNFAEVSSHFPVAGSVYQWTKYLSNKHYAWFTGWIYLFAGILTVTAVDVTVPIVLIPLLQNLGLNVPNTTSSQVIIGALVLISTTVLNIYGVRLVAIVNNTGVVFEILGMVVFALVLLIFYHHQDASVIFNGHALVAGGANGYGTFFAAMFMSLFVIYGFDTASTLAEETKNPRREAPRAVILAIVGAAIIGAIFLFATLIAIPGDIDKYVANVAAAKAAPPVDIITSNLPGWAANLYLLVVFAAIYVCCLAIQTATIRLAFGMARDGKLPLGRVYNKVSPTLHTPVGTCIVIGVLAAIPLLYYAGAGLIAIAATGMIYLSYLLGNLAVLFARFRGWPTEATPFKLGGWGTIVNVLALLWGASMLVNFLWPRGSSNPPLSGLPNISLSGALGNIPIFEATLGVILIVGAIYYVFAQRGMPDTKAVAPAESPAV
ncbi:MAG TPA: amino acid permease [Candidatus Dormibacteraeota bacterium]|nr:amino acid permease [Candidatus Dormibacteraeota bacterium]